MAKTRFIQSSFTSGVLSPLLRGRTDLAQYYQGLETGKNFVLMPQGGIRRRPGTKFVAKALPILTRNTTVNTMPNGGVGANISDEDDTTSTTTTTSISTLNPYVVAKQDLGSSVYIELADVRGIYLTSATSIEFKIQSSDDDITYTDVVNVPLVGSAAQDFRLLCGAAARYWQLVRIGGADLTTDKVTLTDFNLWEKSATLSNVKLLDFSVESNRHYLFSFTDGNCRIYRRSTSAYVADIKTPYTTANVKEIRSVQSESVMITIQQDNHPQRIINLGTDTDWIIDLPPFSNIPQYDFNDSLSPTPTSDIQIATFTAFVAGDTFQIDVEGILSKNITYAGDTSAAEQSSTAENIRKNLQDMPNFGESGVSVVRTGAGAYTITTADESAKDFKLFSAFPTSGTATKSISFIHSVVGVARKEDVWSSTRGYQKTGCFYEGRLCFGGTKSKPQSLLMSKSGSVFNFNIGEGSDDDAIFTTISSRKLNNIVDIFPGRNLQIFTDGSEFTVNSRPVTPTSLTITPQTSHGSLNLEAKEIDGATIFADRNGKSIKEYLYSFNEDAYTASDTSVLSPELIKVPVDIDILGGTSSDDANWVFIVNSDGSATVLNTLRAQDINGFTEWTTSGFILDVAVVDDALYMTNKRTAGGVESIFIEEWDFNSLLDNSLKTTNSGHVATLSGFDHLEGETVSIVGDGSVLPDRLVTGGDITLTASEIFHTNIEVGLRFVPELKPMPLNTNIGSGQNSMRLKKIIRMNMLVNNTFGLSVDGVDLPIRTFGDSSVSPLDTPPNQKTGIIDDIYSTIGWSRDEMPTFKLLDPTPATILSIEYEVESS